MPLTSYNLEKLSTKKLSNGKLTTYWGPANDHSANSSSIKLSTPEDNEKPKNCYYTFHIEFYTTQGPNTWFTFLLIGNRNDIGKLYNYHTLQTCLNDRIIVDVENAATGMEVTIHWHGIFQNGFQYYDGVPYVTQCPIASSSTFSFVLGPAAGSEVAATFNNISYVEPSAPLLSQRSSCQTICKENVQNDCTEPCTCSDVINAKLNNIVELVIYDEVPLPGLYHPFHLHGYEFRVFSMGDFGGRNISRSDIEGVIDQHTQRLKNGEYSNPPGKDTIKLINGGYAIIRFKANNPGWWLFHCHFTWHHITGMKLVIHVGDKSDLPPVPRGFPVCNNWRPAVDTLKDFYNL
ncbi:uncharacterized protein [Bombus flavifrons]|uniref:uncharacterized protein n=1 Tax=Bombus flavifrons TaxID=103934 RepID=UPI003704BCD2